MKKKNNKIKIFIIFLIIICILLGIVSYYFYLNNLSFFKSNYTTQKTSSNKSNNTTNNSNYENKDNKENNKKQLVEKEISKFSTKIYSTDSARQNNIKITCNTLNNTVVKNGETFSFCSTVGQATTAKGYKKAEIFDNNGNIKMGLGGGNCQISSTLYNAVLKVSSLTVVERHNHSNYVPYIQKGKDAAVAYGSYDFKFKNNYGTNIKIVSTSDSSYVNIQLFSQKYV